MEKSEIVKVSEKIAEKAGDTYEKVEQTVVGSYEKIEKAVVGGYTKVENRFVARYLTKDGESVEEAKARLKQENNTLK